MTKEERKEILGNVQSQLEKLQGEKELDILFLASQNNRGVFGGTLEGLACLFAFNMVKYKVFRDIVTLAENLVNEHEKEIQEFISEDAPTHEIVDTFGNDFDKWIVKK